MSPESLFCCPQCKGELRARGEQPGIRPDVSSQPGHACARCRLEYPVVDGVVDFLPHGYGEQRKTGQKLMEADWMVRIYESRLWRANWVVGWSFGISLADEMSLIDRILDLGPSDAVLDLACGPGLYARRFARGASTREVLGLDLSWPMLRYGARKAERGGISNLTFAHGDAHHLPFRDASLDAVNCCGAMHLFPDVRQVLGELQRVIRPKGRFSTAVFLARDRDPLSGLRRASDKWGGRTPFPEAGTGGTAGRGRLRARRLSCAQILDDCGRNPAPGLTFPGMRPAPLPSHETPRCRGMCTSGIPSPTAR